MVIRSAGAGASRRALEADALAARNSYAAMLATAKTSKAPARLDMAEDAIQSLVSSFAAAPLAQIVLDDPYLVNELKHLGPDIILDQSGGRFADAGFEDIFETALSRSIDVSGDAQIVIDRTEAFTVIDVNLGSQTRGKASQAILDANRAAAAEIAHQLRLRNISGAVVVDFISMRSRADREMVQNVLKEAASADSNAIEWHGWTRLGHLELTRRRKRPSLAEILLDPADTVRKSSYTVGYTVLRAIARTRLPPGSVEIFLNPEIIALLRGELAPWFQQASRNCGHLITLRPEPGRDRETFDIGPASSFPASSFKSDHE